MAGDHPTWDFVFVSDLHLSLGYDPERRAYHPREDFFFDDVFFRWLRSVDADCAEGRRWELVFVGDSLDFFPVEQEAIADYFREQDRRREALDLADYEQVVQYWERQFGAVDPEEQVPGRIQRLIFEDDVLEGRIRLEPVSVVKEDPISSNAAPVPKWATELYGRYWPQVSGGTRRGDEPFVLRAPTEGEATAFRVAWKDAPQTTPGRRGGGPQAAARSRDEAFERRYGFLPTPEKSTEKLAAIYRGHPVFFRALAWFVGHGHRIVFLRGNHDLELHWPSVQERIRECVAREYRAAFQDAMGYDARDLVLPDLGERIGFQPGWFYYRRGAFYAEHGCQHEMLNASPNPIRPVLPGNKWLLNPDVGGLGVVCFHNHLENTYPAWENQGNYAVFLLDLIRRDPFSTVAMLVRHGLDFVRMAQRLWMAGQAKDQVPSKGDFASYAGLAGLDPGVVRAIYRAGARPLLLRRPLAWFLFSPWGHVVKVLILLVLAALAIGGATLWYLVVAPVLAGLLPDDLAFTTVGPALQLLAKMLLWLVPPVAYALLERWLGTRRLEDFLPEAARRIHEHLREKDPDLRYVIAGHDHQPDTRPIALGADGRHVYYLNAGTWTPTFAEGKRRLQTLGREVQFTFVRLVKCYDGYEADLLRWNDDAGRAEPQIVPPGEA